MRQLSVTTTFVSLFLTLTGTLPSVARPAAPEPSPFRSGALAAPAESLAVRFQDELDALRAEYGFPGATAAFVLPDGTVGAAATGLADVERGLPMASDSRMLAASIGKTFVAALVLALATEGRLSLDDSLSAWLGDRPWFARLPNHAGITLRHLLTHTSGLPDHVHSPAFVRAWTRRSSDEPPLPPDSLVRFILDREPLFPPGEGWAYTDTGYILLGLVAEAAGRAGLFDEIDRRFLRPLNLTGTSASDRRTLPGLAAGYLPADDPFGLPRKTTVAPGEWRGTRASSGPAAGSSAPPPTWPSGHAPCTRGAPCPPHTWTSCWTRSPSTPAPTRSRTAQP